MTTGIQTLGCAKGPKNGRVSRALEIRKGTALVAVLFLGAVLLSGCEFVYLPECDTDCQAGGGNDSYGGAQ